MTFKTGSKTILDTDILSALDNADLLSFEGL